MKIGLIIFLSISSQFVFSQVFDIAKAHKMLTTGMSVQAGKKLLSNSYDFTGDGGLSDAGNITYNFEAKNQNKYSFVFLYSTAFERIGYIQFYDDLKQIMNYRKQFLNLGFKYLDTRFPLWRRNAVQKSEVAFLCFRNPQSLYVSAGFSPAYTLLHKKTFRETPTQERLGVVII